MHHWDFYPSGEAAVHTRFAQLAYNRSIGGTHVTQLDSAKNLPGPKATLFLQRPARNHRSAPDSISSELANITCIMKVVMLS